MGNDFTESVRNLDDFWKRQMTNVENTTSNDFKNQELPLARIKKIMKLDEDVKMISGEAPILFAKAAEIFIEELCLRAWVNTTENKRRTISRNDIAMAIAKYDQFDFLIDIVSYREAKQHRNKQDSKNNSSNSMNYYVQLPSQTMSSGQPLQIVQTVPNQPYPISPQIIQVPVAGSSNQNVSESTNPSTATIVSPVVNISTQHFQTIIQNTNTSSTPQILVNPSSITPTQYLTTSGQLLQIQSSSSSPLKTNKQKRK